MKFAIKNWYQGTFISDRPVSKAVSFKLLIGLILLVSLASHNQMDPSPFNLLTPVNGISNWLGLPGALLSGFLFDFLGMMAYLIPLFLLLFTRKNSILNPKYLIPDLLEFLVLVALISLLALTLNTQLEIETIGIWGAVSTQALSTFPGGIYAILILLAYQPVYFKNVRLDLSLGVVLWRAILIVTGLLGHVSKKATKTLRKSARYSSINWLSPLTLIIAKSSEKIRIRLKSGYLQTRRKLEDVKISDKASLTVEKVFGKKNHPEDALKAYSSSQKELEEKTLTRIIKSYRKTLYKSDSKAFLKLEEEI